MDAARVNVFVQSTHALGGLEAVAKREAVVSHNCKLGSAMALASLRQSWNK
jgi:hypothetical protein